MERTASRPPSGGGANWAIFFAPLAATGVVILGAMIFFWVSDPEPADRPTVERVDLREVEPTPRSGPLSSVRAAGDAERGERDGRPEAVERADQGARAEDSSVTDAVPSAASDEVEEEDFEDDDEDFVDMTTNVERTPEERQAGKARLRESIMSVPFMAPMMKRIRERRENGEQGGEQAVDATDQEVPNPEALNLEAAKEAPPEGTQQQRLDETPPDAAAPMGAAGAPAQ